MPGTEHLAIHYKHNGSSGHQTPLNSLRLSTPHPGELATATSNQSMTLVCQIHHKRSTQAGAGGDETGTSTTTQHDASSSVEISDFWSEGGDMQDTGAQSVYGSEDYEGLANDNGADDDTFNEVMRQEAERWGMLDDRKMSHEAMVDDREMSQEEKTKGKCSKERIAASDYEHEREANIAQNKVLLVSLGLDKDIFQKKQPTPRPRKKDATSALDVQSEEPRRSTRHSALANEQPSQSSVPSPTLPFAFDSSGMLLWLLTVMEFLTATESPPGSFWPQIVEQLVTFERLLGFPSGKVTIITFSYFHYLIVISFTV
jgi:hypothetical protein